MGNMKSHKEIVAANIDKLSKDTDVQSLSRIWCRETNSHGYTYNFSWLGRPIIQYPQDMVALQEIIWNVKPDLIIETGIAHGGSLLLSASMLALLDMCEAIENKVSFNSMQSKRKVVGIDIDIREHNRNAIEAHPMSSWIKMIEGSSVDLNIVRQVNLLAKEYKRVMVLLDSNHTHEHVLAELYAYAPLTSIDSYCVVFDTLIEDMPDSMFPDRPWGKGNNPKTAVWQYLNEHDQFVIDVDIPAKLQITVAPDGFLKRMK